MSRFAAIVRRVFMPRLHYVLLIAVPAFALMIHALTTGIPSALAWPLYVLAFYALVLIVVAAVRACRSIKTIPLPKCLAEKPAVIRWRTDAHYRIGLGLTTGLMMNLLYVVLKLVVGFVIGNGWLVALGGYYAMLAIMRVMLLLGWWKGMPLTSQWRSYRACGVALVPMNQALMVVVIYLVHKSISYNYPGNLIYAMAGYAFYAVISSVINMVRLRRLGSPLISAAKAVGLVCALVSLLALQTALIFRFGGGDTAFARIMNSITGGAVCLTVLAMGIYMILRANRALRRMRADAISA